MNEQTSRHDRTFIASLCGVAIIGAALILGALNGTLMPAKSMTISLRPHQSFRLGNARNIHRVHVSSTSPVSIRKGNCLTGQVTEAEFNCSDDADVIEISDSRLIFGGFNSVNLSYKNSLF